MVQYAPQHFAGTYEEVGRPMWEFLCRPDKIGQLVRASNNKRPAVEYSVKALVKEFGDRVQPHRVRQMVGHMVCQIMASRRYVLDRKRVYVRNRFLFKTGASYRSTGQKGKRNV